MRIGQAPWQCPYCRWLIDAAGRDLYAVGVDHLLDEHRDQLIKDRPQILHGPRAGAH